MPRFLQPNTFVKKNGCSKFMENINCVDLHTLQMVMQMPGIVGSLWERPERGLAFLCSSHWGCCLHCFLKASHGSLWMKKQRCRKFKKPVQGHVGGRGRAGPEAYAGCLCALTGHHLPTGGLPGCPATCAPGRSSAGHSASILTTSLFHILCHQESDP